jgi:hypothetical protein
MNSTDEFKFEQWADLAERDPNAFEEARRRVLQSLIDSAPSAQRRRLQGLQWRIDAERERAPNPLVACMKISRMMWDKVLGEDGLLDGLEQISGTKPLRAKATREADVLEFKRSPESR